MITANQLRAARALLNRSTANRRPCRPFSPYHPAHGSKRRRRPRQRRFPDEAGFRTGKCGDRIDQSRRCELSRRSRRSSQGARYEAKDEEREAVQTFVPADFGADQVTAVILGKRISRYKAAPNASLSLQISAASRCCRRPRILVSFQSNDVSRAAAFAAAAT